MNELLNRLSSYNIFNNLFPGAIFALLADRIGEDSFVQQDIVLGLFVYYFIGLAISRVGSLVLEPLFKRISFVDFADYSAYVAASKADSKLEVLSETNNMYRTLSAMFVLLLLLKGYVVLEMRCALLKEWGDLVLIVALLLMFSLSYRKQTAYIAKRVTSH